MLWHGVVTCFDGWLVNADLGGDVLREMASSSSGAVDARAILAAAASRGKKAARPSAAVDREDDLEYDLGHLCAFDPSPVDEKAFAADPSAYLLRCARENAQMLTNKLYSLLEGATSKQVIPLPTPAARLPREKPLPEPKPVTRWEKFAKDKGIVKKKRSKMVWDEDSQQWAPRYGFGRAGNPKDAPENWVVEAKPGDDGTVDPFEARKDARKEKLAKQKRQEERNRLAAAHAATVGTAPGSSGMERADKKSYLKQAIAAAQVSTASVGRFDKALPNEPSKTAGKRKQYEGSTGADVADRDAQRTAAVYSKMFPDGGAKQAQIVNRDVAAKASRMAAETSSRSGGGKKGGSGKGKGGGAKGSKGAGKGKRK